MNNQVTYPFLFQMNFLIFQNPYEFFQFFFTGLKKTKILKKSVTLRNSNIFL